jgi:hypothetical protein
VQSTKILHFHQTHPKTGDCNAVYYFIIAGGDCQAFFRNFFLFPPLFSSLCEKAQKTSKKVDQNRIFFFHFFSKTSCNFQNAVL